MELSLAAGRKGPYPDDTPYPANGDSWGNLLVAEAGPKYLEWNRRGLLFNAGSTTALAIPIFSTPTNGPSLWNPILSNFVVVICKLNLALAAGATIPDSGFGFALSMPATDMVATGMAMPTFTNIPPWNLRDLSLDTIVRYAQVMTFTAVPTQVLWLGLSQYTLGAATAAGFGDTGKDLEGLAVLWPGMMASLVASVASATTFMPSFVYAKLPLPANQ